MSAPGTDTGAFLRGRRGEGSADGKYDTSTAVWAPTFILVSTPSLYIKKN